jgi:diguanylate cyclase (GGDEF)-like protein/PAS domain S-box-containing protein
VAEKLEQIISDQANFMGQMNKALTENRKLSIQFGSASKQVRELNEFIQIMLSMSPFAICIIQNSKLIYTNKAFCDIVGYSARQLRDLTPWKMVFAEDRDHVRKSLRDMIEGNAHSFFMFRVMTSNETIKWILGSVALIHMNEKQALLGNFVDLTEGRVMQLAYNDPLTGLANRKLMMDRLEQAIVSAKRRTSRLALLFLDLDEFKDVNDVHGHKTGDQLLIEIANRLREVVRRENDTIARIGGDEFLILLTDIQHRSQIEIVADHLFEKFKKPLTVGDPPLEMNIRFSIGIALFPEHGDKSDELIHNADKAMYRVKKQPGKNHFAFFSA